MTENKLDGPALTSPVLSLLRGLGALSRRKVGVDGAILHKQRNPDALPITEDGVLFFLEFASNGLSANGHDAALLLLPR